MALFLNFVVYLQHFAVSDMSVNSNLCNIAECGTFV